MTLRLHSKGTPVRELAIFGSVLVYLYGIYALVYWWNQKKATSDSKVKGG